MQTNVFRIVPSSLRQRAKNYLDTMRLKRIDDLKTFADAKSVYGNHLGAALEYREASVRAYKMKAARKGFELLRYASESFEDYAKDLEYRANNYSENDKERITLLVDVMGSYVESLHMTNLMNDSQFELKERRLLRKAKSVRDTINILLLYTSPRRTYFSRAESVIAIDAYSKFIRT